MRYRCMNTRLWIVLVFAKGVQIDQELTPDVGDNGGADNIVLTAIPDDAANGWGYVITQFEILVY